MLQNSIKSTPNTDKARKEAETNKNISFKDIKVNDILFLRSGMGKDNSIKDYYQGIINYGAGSVDLCQVSRIEEITEDELNNYNFLDKKPEGFAGGYNSLDYNLEGVKIYTKEIKHTLITFVCMLRTPSRCVFVDPEGYGYSRYIFTLPNSENNMFKYIIDEIKEEKRQEEETAQQKKEEAERAALAYIEECKKFLVPVEGYDPKTTKKNILSMLKYKFEGVKFSARKFGSSYSVSWTDGPTPAEVRAVCSRFVDTSFDIMTDYNEYTPSMFTKTFGGIDCNVETNRTYTDKVLKDTLNEIKEEYPEININEDLRSQIVKTDKVTKFYKFGCGLGSLVCLYDLVNEYLKTISFYAKSGTTTSEDTNNTGDTGATGTTATTASTDSEPGTTATDGTNESKGLTLIQYSAKAVALIGDTFPLKEQLKKLGGRWNSRLTCGAGWVFSRKKEEELRAAFNLA